MTRKRVGAGLLEAFSETCECCKGRGVIINTDLVMDRPGKANGAGEKLKAVASASSGSRRRRKSAPDSEESEEPERGTLVAEPASLAETPSAATANGDDAAEYGLTQYQEPAPPLGEVFAETVIAPANRWDEANERNSDAQSRTRREGSPEVCSVDCGAPQ